MQRLQTDDQPTEISSPDETTPTTYPSDLNGHEDSHHRQNHKQLSDTDKQILRWAAALELETIELREHSQRLIRQLNSKYVDFEDFVKKFGTIETRLEKKVVDCLDGLKKEVREDISRCMTAVSKKAEAITTTTTKVSPSLSGVERDKASEYRLRNIGSQMESMQLLLVHISKELLNLNTRQIGIEAALERFLVNKTEENRDHYYMNNEHKDCNSHRTYVTMDGTTYEKSEELKSQDKPEDVTVKVCTSKVDTSMNTRSKTGLRGNNRPVGKVVEPRVTKKRRKGRKWGRTRKRRDKPVISSISIKESTLAEPSSDHPTGDMSVKPRTLIPWEELTDTEPFNHFSSEL